MDSRAGGQGARPRLHLSLLGLPRGGVFGDGVVVGWLPSPSLFLKSQGGGGGQGWVSVQCDASPAGKC